MRVKIQTLEMVVLPSGVLGHQDKSSVYKGVPCTREIFGSMMEFFDQNPRDKSLILSSFICPNITEGWEIGGKPSDLSYKTIKYEIFPCVYENDPSDCKDLRKSSSLHIFYLQAVPDFSNYESPMYRETSYDRSIGMGPTIQPFITNKMKRVVVNDRTSDIFDSKEKLNYFEFGDFHTATHERSPATTKCSRVELDSGVCKPVFEMLLKPSGDTDTYTRKYVTFLEVIGNIGGFADIVVLFFGMIYGIYNSKKLELYLKNKIWGTNSKMINKVFEAEKEVDTDLNQDVMSSEAFIDNTLLIKCNAV